LTSLRQKIKPKFPFSSIELLSELVKLCSGYWLLASGIWLLASGFLSPAQPVASSQKQAARALKLF
jgi:hypothetical protein